MRLVNACKLLVTLHNKCAACLHYKCTIYFNFLIYIYIYIYYIYIWYSSRKDLWSSYRKLAWVGFELTTTELRSDALTDWAIRPWVQLAPRANFLQLLRFHRLFSVKFHFSYYLRQSPRLFSLNSCWGNHMSVVEWIDTYGIHHWRILCSSYRKLAWLGFEPTTTEFRSDALTDWGPLFILQKPLVLLYTLSAYNILLVRSQRMFVYKMKV